MNDKVIKVLEMQDEPKELADLRMRLQGLVKMSRDTMKDYYPMWDRNNDVYQGKRTPDEQDRKAEKRKEPGKVFVPLTHAQVQTFVSFGVTLMTQRDYFFELEGSGIEDQKPAKLAQAVLQRDLEYNKFTGILLPQALTDVARYGLAIFKSQWHRQTCPYLAQVPDPKWQPNPALPTQMAAPMIPSWQEKTKYLGNQLEVVSPYRWFPDVRLPLTRYRDGEFCADENEKSKPELEKLQREGFIAGLEHVPSTSEDAMKDRRSTSNERTKDVSISNDKIFNYLITEVQVRLNPAKTLIAENTPIDETLDADVICQVWIANDGRIVRIGDLGYEHNEFLFDAAQFFNDQNQLVNFGIAELLGPMQDIMDWLMNARVTNVRKTVQNFFVVDPKGVHLEDLQERRSVIRLKSTIPDGMAINQFIQQLNVTDVTAGHIQDMGVVKNFSEEATGLTENLMGRYAEGRRSARESSNVNANAAGRAILPLKGFWQGAILPLGRKMLSNLRQGLNEETIVRVIGLQRFILSSMPDPTTGQSPLQSFVPVNKQALIGEYDFLVFEATLPSQRMAIAAAIQAAGDVLIKNPMAIFALQLDPKLLFDEWLELQGVRNAERFRLTPQRAQEIIGLAQLGGNQASPEGPQGPSGGGPSGGSKKSA
jgi:hypothetical protein